MNNQYCKIRFKSIGPQNFVHQIMHSPGRPLPENVRAPMESRFNHDFSQVRLHTDLSAEESADAINARAFTIGNDMFFKARHYTPEAMAGQKLLAHELTHVVQQEKGNGSLSAETRADAVSERIIRGESITPEMIGTATPGLYAQNDEDSQQHQRAPITERAFQLNWPTLSLYGLSPVSPFLMKSGGYQLTSPSLRMSSSIGFNPGLSINPYSLSMQGLSTLSLPQYQLRQPWLMQPTSTVPSGTQSPAAPSRLPLVSSGQFSLGLRLGFPEVEMPGIPDAPPSALQESLRRATIMSEILSGKIPTGWEAVDKAKLAGSIWGIFSTYIAPDLAQRISSSLSTPVGPSRTSYQLDIVILGDFNGGGLSLTARY